MAYGVSFVFHFNNCLPFVRENMTGDYECFRNGTENQCNQ